MGSRPVERFLVLRLRLKVGGAVNLPFSLLHLFRVTETRIHAALVVADEAEFALELGVEVVLTLSERVCFPLGGGVRDLPEIVRGLIIDSQLVVEGALSVSWLIHRAQTSRVVGNVGVSALAVIVVNYSLRVDRCK